MINIQLDSGRILKLPTEWQEIDLMQAEKLFRLSKELPIYVREEYALWYEELTTDVINRRNKLLEQITRKDEVKTLPTLFGEFIKVLTDISDKDLNTLNRMDRTLIYDQYIKTKIMGLLFYPDYTPKNISKFKHDKTTYYLPTVSEGFGVRVPGSDLVADDFCQVSDLEAQAADLEGGRWEVAPLIIGILCREKVDGVKLPYNGQEAIARSAKLKNLPMDIVFEVFFCLDRLSDIYTNITPILVEEAQRRSQN